MPASHADMDAHHTANYASFTTAFLTSVDIQEHWADLPIEINDVNSVTTLEYQFLDAVGRVFVNEHFATHITKGSVIDCLRTEES